MKGAVIALSVFLLLTVTQVFCAPVEENGEAGSLLPTSVQSPGEILESTTKRPLRQPRILCDLLGPLGPWSDALCAAHCLGHGHRGGYCSKKRVCTCR